MKKKILFMLTVVCVLMILTSVGCRRVPYDEDLQILGSYIPGFATYDTRVSRVRIIETDSFGRRLFCFQSNISAFENDQVAYAIVQKTEKSGWYFSKVFFYDDLFYLIDPNDSPDFSDLKEQNDWEQPLVEARMSFLNIPAQRSSYLITHEKQGLDLNTWKRVNSELFQEIGVTKDQVFETCGGLCYDFKNQPGGIYWYSILFHDLSDRRTFLLVVDKNGMHEWEEVFDPYQIGEQLKTFKLSCQSYQQD